VPLVIVHQFVAYSFFLQNKILIINIHTKHNSLLLIKVKEHKRMFAIPKDRKRIQICTYDWKIFLLFQFSLSFFYFLYFCLILPFQRKVGCGQNCLICLYDSSSSVSICSISLTFILLPTFTINRKLLWKYIIILSYYNYIYFLIITHYYPFLSACHLIID